MIAPGVVKSGKRDGASSSRARECYHCGLPCPNERYASEEKSFCCQGCLTVYEILKENGLGHFYDLAKAPGVKLPQSRPPEKYDFLNDEALHRKLLDFTDGTTSRVTFHLPAIHCIACVWLLENLFRLHEGVGQSRVNFPRKEVSITFRNEKISLGGVAGLLSSLGYPPAFNLENLERRAPMPDKKTLYLQLGLAGFAFGNTMLLSFPAYFGSTISGEEFLRSFFGWLSVAFSLPVLGYSASDYWKAAWLCIRRRILTIDFPIALGIAALFSQSVYEIASGSGGGYLDSFTGLIFFLLCGKLFQQKTFDRLSFDRDYKAFFPLSVIQKTGDKEATIPISNLKIGHRLILRNQELIPADSILIGGEALIDYSFVTGESDPVQKREGDYLYAGGRQTAGAIEVETVKEVSQSYLTSLWNQAAFHKEEPENLNNLTNIASRYFTAAVIAIACLSALFWAGKDASLAIRAFTSVLIVACPCALALAAPFTLGTAQRILGRHRIYLKNASVLERLPKVKAIVFDKTGTLTASGQRRIDFHGEPLTSAEAVLVRSLARHSTHPVSKKISAFLKSCGAEKPVASFQEQAGQGIKGIIDGIELLIGSRQWLEIHDISVPDPISSNGGATHLAIDGAHRGYISFQNQFRPEVKRLIDQLSGNHELALITGDNEKERESLRKLFGAHSRLDFEQSPADKLGFIRALQRQGSKVMMVGDGLNDAGALKQSDVGVAVTEDISAFSPASDVILDADRLRRLPQVLDFSRTALKVILISFIISVIYNVVGISFAAQGLLSPLLSAILMPLSSVTVVSFAVVATTWAGRRKGLS